jgi:cold shock CspA family protein
MATASVISETNRGYFFLEDDSSHQSVFCHISQVKDERCLHVGDSVSYELVPNPARRGHMMAGCVTYVGHVGTAGVRR